ncbi:retrotransposon protein, putative, ty1-copia subclass [Tanacetum coccineum]
MRVRLGKTPSRSFKPLKSTENFWQILELCSLRISFSLDRFWNKREPSLWLLGLFLVDSLVPVMAHETKHRFFHRLRLCILMAMHDYKSNHKQLNQLNHLEEALPEAPPATATVVVRNAYTRRVNEQQEVACLMLASMTPKIQKNLEDHTTFDILHELKIMFQQQAEQELLLDQMERLGYPMPLVLGVNLILTSLSKDYDQFVQNYNMHNMGNTIHELHVMLKFAEKGTHMCNTIQGLKGSQKLNKGALDLYVGDGNCAAVKAIWSFDLSLPSGMVLVLDNCHFAPFITRGVISLSHLWDNGFIHKFMHYGAISVFKDNLYYFNSIPRYGILVIDMHNHVSNERSIYTCSKKKSKRNLDSTFLLHCRLCHINTKRIMKLQQSIDDESFDVCISYIYGRMSRKPFTYAGERANKLLGLIHSDVCGPFRTTYREGANYYVTFTDDFSRYGYVYLIKHKHEVFEMFKTFQNNVENQLGKTIKALRSDRGGEYLSQEFLDHLKSHGIGLIYDESNDFANVLLGYALEYVVRILNMVSTKKVDKTPYEIWHGESPESILLEGDYGPMIDFNDDFGDLVDYFVSNDAPFIVNKEEGRIKERRCKSLGMPCKCVAIMEHEFDIWAKTKENVSQVYQYIFRKKDEGSSDIFKSFLVFLCRLCHLAILCLDKHAHSLHHLESLLTISLDNLCLDNLDILRKILSIRVALEHENVIMNPTLLE